MSGAVWLSWENHRRSREMSKALDIPFHVLKGTSAPGLTPILPFIRSLRFLLRTKEKVIVVQNPSLLLTTLACLLKRRKGYRVIQDLHSYFAQHIEKGVGFRGKIYRLLSRFCIRHADVTVVTNAALKGLVDRLGGTGLVLQDAIPAFPEMKNDAPPEGRSIVYVCTYSDDEPVAHVLTAARLLSGVTSVYITGRIPRNLKTWTVPSNVHLTGYLPEGEYLALLRNADAVMALTTRENTLLCGAYEGLAFRKPLILSRKSALLDYFGENVIYVDNEPGSIADGIRRLYSAKPFFDRHADELFHTLNRDWAGRFEDLRAQVEPAEAVK